MEACGGGVEVCSGAGVGLTFLAVVKLVELAGLGQLLAVDQVVGDVAVGVVRGLPLQDDLRR